MPTEMIKNGGVVQTKRSYYLDMIRTIACICVILLHSSAGFVVNNFGSFDFWIGNIFDSLTRMGVPLFVMVSGALFLDEKYAYTTKKLVSHILKIIYFFIFWSLCYSLFYNLVIPFLKHEAFSIKSLIASFVLGHFHLWFCFMIVGLYFIVPILRLWIKKENKTQIQYFLVLSFVFAMFIPSIIGYASILFPVFSSLNAIMDNLNLKYVGGFTAYFILGWYLNNFEIKHKKTLIVLGTIGILVSVFGTAILSIATNEAHQAYGNLSVHIAFQSMMLFVIVKDRYKDKSQENKKSYKAISFIAKYSLGIYAMHPVLLSVCSHLLNSIGICSSLLCIPITFTFAFVISLIASYVMSKIPLLRRMV